MPAIGAQFISFVIHCIPVIFWIINAIISHETPLFFFASTWEGLYVESVCNTDSTDQ